MSKVDIALVMIGGIYALACLIYLSVGGDAIVGGCGIGTGILCAICAALRLATES